MDDLGDLTAGPNAALVILAFLQADCRYVEYEKELLSLTRDISCNKDDLDDGDLETDGHLSICMTGSFDDIQPSVELQRPRNHAEAEVYHQVAEELREIAAQFERSVVAQGIQNLSGKISSSPSEQWKDHLSWEVDRVMSQAMGLGHLSQEQVIVALTLTLVKGVCEQAPRLLRKLFNTALQYISPVRAR